MHKSGKRIGCIDWTFGDCYSLTRSKVDISFKMAAFWNIEEVVAEEKTTSLSAPNGQHIALVYYRRLLSRFHCYYLLLPKLLLSLRMLKDALGILGGHLVTCAIGYMGKRQKAREKIAPPLPLPPGGANNRTGRKHGWKHIKRERARKKGKHNNMKKGEKKKREKEDVVLSSDRM